MKVASYSTGVVDYTDKRSDYERYGVQEYWRSDPTGCEYHDAAPAGDRLVDGRYESIEIEHLADVGYRGYSEVLGMYLCWEDEMLRFYDPVAGRYLRTHAEDAARADQAEAELRRLRQRLSDLNGD